MRLHSISIARIALDVPLPTLFDYAATGIGRDDIGRRVLVPFGKKIAVGVIVELASSSELAPQRVRQVIAVQRDIPPIAEDVLSLLKFCSRYYHHPLGEAVLNALPTRLRRRQALKLKNAKLYRLTAIGAGIDAASLPTRSKLKRDVLILMRETNDAIDETTLFAIASTARNAVKALLELGWIELCDGAQSDNAAADMPLQSATGPVLTMEQAEAIAAVRETASGFIPWLLMGVTGSGKTEVYLRLIADTLANKRQALVLVPEINLTPQLEALVRARFPSTMVVSLHSGLNESERLHGWLQAQSGVAGIILGTRLSIFTPMPRLGLIVVDEEHDASFKQMDGLRYSARDLALVRARDRAIPIVLGSATPALETFQNAIAGSYRLLTLKQPVNAMPAEIDYIDTRHSPLIDGLSQELLKAIDATIKRGEQSLIFINRRGYAPVLMCRSCNWSADCQRCSAKLVMHATNRRLQCHHCGHQAAIPAACPDCGNHDLLPLGQGTQRIESALERTFPAARILRVDRDTTRRKHAWEDMRRQIHANEVDVLVGTQILAKGHDFPQLNLVGVINADSSLYSTDFRAGERLFARLTQVAGRAGRGASRGRVLIQTEFPDHPLYQALRRHDYSAYARELLAERKQAGFPPFVHQAVLRAEAPQISVALDFLQRAALSAHEIQAAVTVYDPIPAPLVRLAGLERAQLTVQARSRTALQRFLGEWHERLSARAERKVRWALDVDPLEV
ncbi:MAG: replication restart helicase PriA [Betaproteobacteria bacterium]|nr:replication restart helicase PriA [Betaproteobacteria bacterium]